MRALNPQQVSALSASQFKALNDVGATVCRFALDPEQYYDDNQGTVVYSIDDGLEQAFNHNVSVILLFNADEAAGSIGNYDKWFKIGVGFAKRYGPDGEWGRERELEGVGVRIFSAIDEPEGGQIAVKDYVAALSGLAAGVHTIDNSLMVLPGGFKVLNACMLTVLLE